MPRARRQVPTYGVREVEKAFRMHGKKRLKDPPTKASGSVWNIRGPEKGWRFSLVPDTLPSSTGTSSTGDD